MIETQNFAAVFNSANTMLAERSVSMWAGWLLPLVRLGVANVRWACAAPRLATPREQMPIAANASNVAVSFLTDLNNTKL
jgi:hypothetical protein